MTDAADGGAITNKGALPLTIANLETALKLMAAQVDKDGNPVLVQGVHLLVPPALEFTARRILTSSFIIGVGRRMPRERPPTHPGEMLLEEFVKPLGITQTELALRLGVSFPRLNEIIRGKRAMTPNTALRLARVLGMSADFWLGLQSDWDLWHAMRSADATEISRLVPLRTIA